MNMIEKIGLLGVVLITSMNPTNNVIIEESVLLALSVATTMFILDKMIMELIDYKEMK